MAITKGQRTKENILIEALDLYSQKGVQNTSFQEVASSLGITQAALYKYFKNSDELLTEGILLGAQRGREFFETRELPDQNSRKQLLHHLANNLEWCFRNKGFSFAFLALHFYVTQVPQIKKIHSAISELRIQRFEAILKRGNKDGSWSISSPATAAVSLHNYLLGEMLEAINTPRKETNKQRILRVQRFACALLNI